MSDGKVEIPLGFRCVCVCVCVCVCFVFWIRSIFLLLLFLVGGFRLFSHFPPCRPSHTNTIPPARPRLIVLCSIWSSSSSSSNLAIYRRRLKHGNMTSRESESERRPMDFSLLVSVRGERQGHDGPFVQATIEVEWISPVE
jgi:hypothetical protein